MDAKDRRLETLAADLKRAERNAAENAGNRNAPSFATPQKQRDSFRQTSRSFLGESEDPESLKEELTKAISHKGFETP